MLVRLYYTLLTVVALVGAAFEARHWWATAFSVTVLFVVVLTPKYDPAIRIKEWQIKRGWHPES